MRQFVAPCVVFSFNCTHGCARMLFDCVECLHTSLLFVIPSTPCIPRPPVRVYSLKESNHRSAGTYLPWNLFSSIGVWQFFQPIGVHRVVLFSHVLKLSTAEIGKHTNSVEIRTHYSAPTGRWRITRHTTPQRRRVCVSLFPSR